MARSIWKGSITFGLVNIPVGLYSAEKRSEEIHFHLLDKRTLSPVRYKRVNEKNGKEVPWEEIVRGYEYQEGQYVVMSDEDIKRANPEASQTVDILDFVDGEEISPLYYDKPYYLAPQKKGAKSYALLRETLRRTGKVGIAKVVIRTRQYLAAVIPQDDVIVLELMRFDHELRDADDLELPHGMAGVTEKELDMAERLVEGMVGEWEPEKYRDDYRSDLMKLIEKRVESGQIEEVEEAPVPPPDQGAKVVDLMALLKRSVEVSRTDEKAQHKSARKPARKATAKPKTTHHKAAAARKPGAAHKSSARTARRKSA
jgi:DNA end-binding protein Ku